MKIDSTTDLAVITGMKGITRKYQDRPMQFKGVYNSSDCYFKCYEIIDSTNSVPVQSEWDKALKFADKNRLKYLHSDSEINIGYIIFHKGFDSNYIVICWWAHENMLRMFSYASRPNSARYTLVKDGLNSCVWDLLIHSHERNAYVKHILTDPDSASLKNYLEDIYHGKL